MIKQTPLPNENHPISSPIWPMGVADTLEQKHLWRKSYVQQSKNAYRFIKLKKYLTPQQPAPQ